MRRSLPRPLDELKIAVTFKGRSDGGPTKAVGRTSPDSVCLYEPVPGEMEAAIEVLRRHGFVVTGRGRVTLSLRGTRRQFEKAFGTRLKVMRPKDCAPTYYPPPKAAWAPAPDISQVIDDAYIQWPHVPRAVGMEVGGSTALSTQSDGPVTSAADSQPPQRAAPSLNVWADVPRLLNALPIHKAGMRGQGIRLAMIDTGFWHDHGYFKGKGLVSSVALAPGASDRGADANGHGTAMSANVFAIAPEVSFIGVKVDMGRDSLQGSGTSLLEAVQEALRHQPHVLSISLAYVLDDEVVPNGLKALEAEINAAVAAGVVVVAAAGNGVKAFPAQMPAVMAVGGAYVDAAGELRASDYAAAYQSDAYSGRNVPDFCGLVGPAPYADLIMLPVPPGSQQDFAKSAFDGTAADDGWAVMSGTSAAAPQIAGICALLLQRNPALKPATLKALIERTARDVRKGRASPYTDPAGQGLEAKGSRDGATGAGLVDAARAWSQA
jgi:subtilisin family serine protease